MLIRQRTTARKSAQHEKQREKRKPHPARVRPRRGLPEDAWRRVHTNLPCRDPEPAPIALSSPLPPPGPPLPPARIGGGHRRPTFVPTGNPKPLAGSPARSWNG